MNLSELISDLKKTPCSHAWRGFGDALFLEFGPLTNEGNNPKGESTLMIESFWIFSVGTTTVSYLKAEDDEIERVPSKCIGLTLLDIVEKEGIVTFIFDHDTQISLEPDDKGSPGKWSVQGKYDYGD